MSVPFLLPISATSFCASVLQRLLLLSVFGWFGFVGSGFRDPVMEYPSFQEFSHLAQCRIFLYMAAIPPEDKNNSIFSITMNWINLTLSKNDIRVAEWFRALPTLQCPRYTMGSNSPWAFWYFSFQNEFCSNFKGKLLIFANFRKQET